MGKKFIQLDGERVTLIHNMPFDPAQGLGKTEAELLGMGALVEQIPEAEQRPGKTALPYYNAARGFWWDYQDAPEGPASTADVAALTAKLDYMGMMLDVL